MKKGSQGTKLLLGRRTFMKTGAAATLLTSGAISCDPGQPSEGETGTTGTVDSFELEEMTINQMQEKMTSGELSARRIVELYLQRIEATNLQGPELRAVIEVNPDAIAIAEALDKERKDQGPRSRLHGIPIIVKDNIDTHDKMTTTAGSHALKGSIPSQDSFVAGKLRATGAIILAKANLSEWANFRSRHSSSGWSGRGGQCRNPYALDRNPCGSSSGSGVAASANLAAGAIGTETNGSIVCPSNANGIVGIKPTVGLVSRSGIIPISHTQDTAGPMTRTVSDAVHILDALAGPDPRDPATKPAAEKAHADYAKFLSADGIGKIRAGICRQFFGFNADVDELMESAIKEIEKLGVTLVDEVEIPNRPEIGGSSYEVMLYEFKADLNSYLQSLGPGAPVKSLEEIIQFNDSHPELEMPYFGQDILVRAQEKGPLTDSDYVEALEKCRDLSRAKGLDAAMDKDELDVLIAPTGSPAWPTDLVNGDAYGGGSSSPAAIAGYPNITVPMGNIHGLPVGISFFGRAWSEPTLIRMAFAFEQATKSRIKPQFLPTLRI